VAVPLIVIEEVNVAYAIPETAKRDIPITA
jgi:hypothetical protein